ncbi:hypothetical protein [Marinobacter sp. NFXS9]|uniref:hypothetical protein n=1 Tax=Marinobacter sp. NFXS9 TaxID=2818433 RepID=UPI0032DE6C69
MSIANKQIFLHIGTPKTGTSALQKFFMDNLESLERNGFSYPKHGFDGNDISSGNGQEIINIAIHQGVGKARAHLDKLLKKSKSNNVLISSEAFYGHPEIVHRIAPAAKVIVYFRNQLDLVESSYNQSVKRAGQKAPFSVALKRVMNRKEPFYTGELIKRWVDLYGKNNVVFRLYENDSFKNKNIYDDFLYSIGVGHTENFHIRPSKVNVSYCADALDYKRCLNALVENISFPFMAEVDAVLQRYSHDYFENGGQKFSLYSEEELAQADSFFQCYREELADIFGLDKKLFYNNYKFFSPVIDSNKKVQSINRITDLLLAKNPKIGSVLRDALSSGFESSNPVVRKSAQVLSPLLARPDFYNAMLDMSRITTGGALGFSDRQLKAMSEGAYKEADYLRDISIIVDQENRTEMAHKLISRALQLRPNGPKIQELEKHYQRKLQN